MSAPPNDGSLRLDRAVVVTVLSAALTLVSILFAKRGSLGLAQGGAVGYLWLLFVSTFMLQAVRATFFGSLPPQSSPWRNTRSFPGALPGLQHPTLPRTAPYIFVTLPHQFPSASKVPAVHVGRVRTL